MFNSVDLFTCVCSLFDLLACVCLDRVAAHVLWVWFGCVLWYVCSFVARWLFSSINCLVVAVKFGCLLVGLGVYLVVWIWCVGI